MVCSTEFCSGLVPQNYIYVDSAKLHSRNESRIAAESIVGTQFLGTNYEEQYSVESR